MTTTSTMEQWEQERRNAINQMKRLKRAEKAESIAQARLANEKMELDILTSAMLFAEVAHKTGSIDFTTKAAVQAEIIADFRQKRKLNTEIYYTPEQGSRRPAMTYMQIFVSALINRLLPPTASPVVVVVYLTGAMLFRAYRELGLPFAIPPPRPESLMSQYERIANVRTNTTTSTGLPHQKKLDILVSHLRDLTIATNEKEFVRLFLMEGLSGMQCIKFDKKCHRPTVYELNPELMRQKLIEKGCYDEDVLITETPLVFESKP